MSCNGASTLGVGGTGLPEGPGEGCQPNRSHLTWILNCFHHVGGKVKGKEKAVGIACAKH